MLIARVDPATRLSALAFDDDEHSAVGSPVEKAT